MTFPTLYKKASTGAIEAWHQAVVKGEPGDPIPYPAIVTTYGQLGGKLQQIKEHITEGKNIGRSNETTPYEQTVAEATSRWEMKKKKHYVEMIEEAEAEQ